MVPCLKLTEILNWNLKAEDSVALEWSTESATTGLDCVGCWPVTQWQDTCVICSGFDMAAAHASLLACREVRKSRDQHAQPNTERSTPRAGITPEAILTSTLMSSVSGRLKAPLLMLKFWSKRCAFLWVMTALLANFKFSCEEKLQVSKPQ